MVLISWNLMVDGFVHVGIYIPHMFGIGAVKSSHEKLHTFFFGYLLSMHVGVTVTGSPWEN
jgi:hypothetical protein